MKLDLSSDQALFRDTTKKFLENEVPLTVVRKLSEDGRGFDRKWWAEGAELGWNAMLVPEDRGGGSISGEGLLDLCIIAEEMGRAVSPGPLITTNAVIAGLVEAGGVDRSTELDGLVSGETIGTWATYEPGSGWAAPVSVRAQRSDGGYVIDGVKDRVEAADQADLLLVTAATPDGPAQFLVPVGTDGVTVTPSWALDIVRRYGEVRFDGVRVPAEALVGTPGDAALVERQLQIALALQCAEISGVVDRVFEFTVEWAFDRYTFGRPLASYQALKHRFADMKMWLEACHATTESAAQAVQDRSADAAELVSVAKSYVGTRSTEIIQECVQLHGGIGVTWEHDIHLYLRRATIDRALYGTPEEHRRRLADLLGV